MVHHAYIDESGTMDHQGVMTVAAVVFDGAKSAEKLFIQVMRKLNPDYLKLRTQFKKPCHKPPRLHFTDLSDAQKESISELLAEANATVFSASYWHDSSHKSHIQRFGIYKELVKLVTYQALLGHERIDFAIAKQGGWQKYEREFLADLDLISVEFNRNGVYRKADFYLLSAAKPGIQISDFYVGAVRDFHRGLLTPHKFIEHQVVCYEVFELQPL